MHSRQFVISTAFYDHSSFHRKQADNGGGYPEDNLLLKMTQRSDGMKASNGVDSYPEGWAPQKLIQLILWELFREGGGNGDFDV